MVYDKELRRLKNKEAAHYYREHVHDFRPNWSAEPESAHGAETRPYFNPLPENWQNHKHLNVPNRAGRFPIEEGLKSFLGELQKGGFFEIRQPEPKKKRSGWQESSGQFDGPKKKDLENVDNVIADDALDAMMGE